MSKLFLFVAVVTLLFVYAGCSSSSKLPTYPNSPDLPQADYSTPESDVLYSGTFEIDLETQSITQVDRQSDIVYDITWFLPDKCPGGCFRFTIVGVIGTVLEIELTMENPLAIQAYDLRVEYLNLHGKTVLNPDSYTDFLGTPITAIYPFTAFMKENADRAFPLGPGGIDTEILFLDFPPGAGSSVDYAITAHLPGMTPEPYEIGDMIQTGELTPSGGTATISCRVDDHQDDVSAVYLDATPFTGGPVQLAPDPLNPGYYKVEISNTESAPVGEYTQMIMALSANPQNISTYNYIEIKVRETGLLERIVFCSGPMGETQIYSIDPEGIGPAEQWTNETGMGFTEVPKLSPCGAYILYTVRISSEQIKIIDVATGVITNITPGGRVAKYGDFSHDGRRIVAGVSVGVGGAGDLWSMDYDGGNTEQLTTNANAMMPEYNWDDTKIYYHNSSSHEIMIYDVATSGITQYTSNGTWNDCPHGSPDGTQIAWASMYGNTCRWIYISPAGGPWDPWDKIIGFSMCVRNPCFSPDGTKLAVDYGSFDGSEIAIYDLTDDSWISITSNMVGDFYPDWGYMIPH